MDESHISSLIFHVKPDFSEGLKTYLSTIPNLEICGLDVSAGKLVVVLETETMGKIKDHIADFELIEGVITVALVYHHAEDNKSLEEAIA